MSFIWIQFCTRFRNINKKKAQQQVTKSYIKHFKCKNHIELDHDFRFLFCLKELIKIRFYNLLFLCVTRVFSYESGDGTKAQQEGELKQVDPENAGEAVRGSYSYEVI